MEPSSYILGRFISINYALMLMTKALFLPHSIMFGSSHFFVSLHTMVSV